MYTKKFFALLFSPLIIQSIYTMEIPKPTDDAITLFKLAANLHEKTGTFTLPALCDALCDYTAQLHKRNSSCQENPSSETTPLMQLLKRVSLKNVIINSDTLKKWLVSIHVRETENQLLIFQTSSEETKSEEPSCKEALTENQHRALYQKCFAAGSLTTLAAIGMVWSIPKIYHWLRS